MADIVELVEADSLAARRREHPHWHGNQAKGEVALPDSRGHNGCSLKSGLTAHDHTLNYARMFKVSPPFYGAQGEFVARSPKRQVCGRVAIWKTTWDRIRPWPSWKN